MPRRTIEEWMKDHVQPILKRLPRDEEGIRLTQCGAVAAIGWVGLLCLAWCGQGCGGEPFSALDRMSSDAGPETKWNGDDAQSGMSSDAGPETATDRYTIDAFSDAYQSETTAIEATHDASSDVGTETALEATHDASSDAGTETSIVGFADANVCVLATRYSCGPNQPIWWGSPPQTFCLATNNAQHLAYTVPPGCNTCETYNCGCIAAHDICRNQQCSDQGGRVFVMCGM